MSEIIERARRTSRCARAVALAGALALTPLSASVAQESPIPGVDPELIEAALAEGVVTLYTTQNEEISHATAQGFEQAFPGMSVRILRLAAIPLYSRVSSEIEGGIHEVDVLSTGDQRTFTENPEWWEQITPELVPTVTLAPERSRQPNFVITAQGAAMMAYNTDMISAEEAPQTWTDVLDPRFQGRCLIVDPRAVVTNVSWLEHMVEVYGEEFLESIPDQNCQIVSAGTPGVQEVAAGGAALVFPVNRAHIMPIVEQGAPVEGVEPWAHSDIAALGSETSVGIAAQAPNPNAARLYMTWLLTPEAQKINCAGAYASYTLSDEEAAEVGCPVAAERFQELYDLSDERRNYLYGLVGLD